MTCPECSLGVVGGEYCIIRMSLSKKSLSVYNWRQKGEPVYGVFCLPSPVSAHLELPLSPSSSPHENRMRIVPVIAHSADHAAQTSKLPCLPPLQSGDQSVCPRDFRRVK